MNSTLPQSSPLAILKAHYDRIRRDCPGDSLLILFGVDGTIFDGCDENIMDPQAVLASHRPCKGMLDLARWFQLQPGVRVGFLTGRPESQRAVTLRALEVLAEQNRLSVDPALVAMRPDASSEGVAAAKIAAVRTFREAGLRVFACIDNDDAGLAAIKAAIQDPDLLLVSTGTLTDPARASGQPAVDICDLIDETDLPSGVQYVWHGINDAHNLREFAGSRVTWGEIDVRLDPDRAVLVAYHDPLDAGIKRGHQPFLAVEEIVRALEPLGKSFKFDLKEGGTTLVALWDLAGRYRIPEDRLWFNAVLDDVPLLDFQEMATRWPGAIRQCPIGDIIRRCGGDQLLLRDALTELSRQGMTRFSLHWNSGQAGHLARLFEAWGFELNIYGVTDLRSFLRAALIKPCSVTADFNFPAWNYHGRGSGQEGVHIEI